MKRFLVGTILLASLFVPLAQARSINAFISDTAPYQGDTVVISFTGSAQPLTGLLGSDKLKFFNYRGGFTAVAPIRPTAKTGNYALHVQFADGTSFDRTIRLRAKNFVSLNLGIPKELGLTTQGLTTKLAEQKVSIDSTVSASTDKVYFGKAFGLPLANNTRIASTFGEIRKTGDTSIRHWGIDFGGPEGSAVGAMSGGIVKSVYYDQVYGKVVIVDHGEGIYSLYMHLKEQKVKEGDVVERGTVIGTLGKTGYSTAPHLHLSMKINSIPVDPIRFVMAFK